MVDMKENAKYIVEVKRSVRDVLSKLDALSSRGELNSDGVKALVRIIKMLKRSGRTDEAKRLSKVLRSRREIGALWSLLHQVEENLD
ncbi:MAG: hypothetical protein QW701_05460 [Candidatus Nezhaarchaeales archaeon]